VSSQLLASPMTDSGRVAGPPPILRPSINQKHSSAGPTAHSFFHELFSNSSQSGPLLEFFFACTRAQLNTLSRSSRIIFNYLFSSWTRFSLSFPSKPPWGTPFLLLKDSEAAPDPKRPVFPDRLVLVYSITFPKIFFAFPTENKSFLRPTQNPPRNLPPPTLSSLHRLLLSWSVKVLSEVGYLSSLFIFDTRASFFRR